MAYLHVPKGRALWNRRRMHAVTRSRMEDGDHKMKTKSSDMDSKQNHRCRNDRRKESKFSS